MQRIRSLSLADADRDARWATVATTTYRGTRCRDGAAQELALEAAGVQPLALRCTTQTVSAGRAGAHVVPPGPDCANAGRWDPPDKSPVVALMCGTATSVTDDDDEADDDDRLLFADPPGLEFALEDDACWHGGELRRSR